MCMIKILIVDDDTSVRKVLQKILSSKGYEILLSADPLNALTLIKNNLPQFIILDRHLPFFEGDSLLKKIKNLYPSIKVIILSGYDDEGSKEKLLSYGADLFLSKATNINKIIEQITLFINKNSQEHKKVEKKDVKVLIVDDEENIRKILFKFISNKGFITYTAENGTKALEIMKKENICIIFLDIFMPEMNGEIFLEKALEINPKAKIVIISGNETEELARKMLEKGAIDYLKKPINFTQLENITRVLSIIID